MKVILVFLLGFSCSIFAQKANINSNINSNKLNKNLIKIGNQIWMTEDLKTKVFNNGDSIPIAKSSRDWEFYSVFNEPCMYILPNGTFVYNGYALFDKRGMLPNGIRIPTLDDFNILVNFLGGGDNMVGKGVQQMVTYPLFNVNPVNSIYIKNPSGKSGFNAKRGGYIYDTGNNIIDGDEEYERDENADCSFWWTSTRKKCGWEAFATGHCSEDLGPGASSCNNLGMGFSIRGIKK